MLALLLLALLTVSTLKPGSHMPPKYLHHNRQYCLAPVHLTVALRPLGNEILH